QRRGRAAPRRRPYTRYGHPRSARTRPPAPPAKVSARARPTASARAGRAPTPASKDSTTTARSWVARLSRARTYVRAGIWRAAHPLERVEVDGRADPGARAWRQGLRAVPRFLGWWPAGFGARLAVERAVASRPRLEEE